LISFILLLHLFRNYLEYGLFISLFYSVLVELSFVFIVNVELRSTFWVYSIVISILILVYPKIFY
jgi:hypothetical protein